VAATTIDQIVYPSTPFPLDDALILLGRRGSEAHGTYVPNTHNGVDDRDLMGIVIPPKDYYIGMKQWDVVEAINDPWDVVLYELRKFVHLLCKQNPNVLQILWLEDEDYLPVPRKNRLIGLNLVRSRLTFRHAGHARNSFVGYAHGQLKRMTAFDRPAMQRISDLEALLLEHGVNLGHAAEGKLRHERPELQILLDQYVGMRRTYHKAYMGAKRWSMVQKIGYDPKNAAHLVRLLHLGYEYLTTGRMNVRRTWDRDMLIEMKTGQWPLDAVKAHADEWFAKIQDTETILPDAIDEDEINTLVTSIVEDFHFA
jgi:predicted nucleotidyltransferase